jgi:multicomponent Na+:H+ antiporter subunit D
MILLACLLTLSALLFGKSSFLGAWKPLTLLFFCLAASLAALAESWFGFVIWVELSSLALALLVASKDGPVARMYLYSQLTGGALLLLGAALISTPGSLAPLGPVPETWYPLFLFALGFKAAFPGLHFWLPPTHSRAPSEVSLLLSGYAVKMGIYGLLRLVDRPSPALLCIGVTMALYGVFQALMQHDTKRLLACHTVSQLGFMVAALATGTPQGRQAALFYLVAHALFKGLLFLTAGSLEKIFGSRDLNLLGGAVRKVPFLFALFLLGAGAIAGVPGTAGYVGKGMVKSALASYPLPLWSLQLAGVGTVLSFCKFGRYAFLGAFGEKTGGEGKTRSLPLTAWGGMLLLAFPLLLLGILPQKSLLFSGGLEKLWSPGSLGSALLPLGTGAGLFLLLPKLFRPKSDHFPDAEDLLGPAAKLLRHPLKELRHLHSGKLRYYLFYLTFALIAMLFLLEQ